ncbi:MAG: SPOR domain-containing protein [Pseudomonadota bacterium]
MKSQQGEKGGFVLGLIVGLLVGLALALGVALYVTKVPVPFVNKVPQRTPEQDAAEIERNKNWDPNAPLGGKPVKPPATAASGTVTPAPAVAARPAAPAQTPDGTLRSQRDPAAILSGQPVSPAAAPMVPARSAKPEPATFTYFVQAGAFGKPEDAEAQRAKLAMLGLGAKVTEREQSGRTVYRVRLGPFERKEDADAAQEKLQAASVEAALVRVENTAR